MFVRAASKKRMPPINWPADSTECWAEFRDSFLLLIWQSNVCHPQLMRCHFEKLSFFTGEVSLGLGTKDFQRVDKVLCHLWLHVEFIRDWVLHDPQGNHRLAGQGLHQ